MRLVTCASELSTDPMVADWLFESAVIDYSGDPLNILLQRELEAELDAEYDFVLGGN